MYISSNEFQGARVMKIMNEKVLCLKWSEVVRKFSLSMAHAYENYTLRALLDASEMTVDGMKEKWLDVLILDTLVSMFQWSPQEIEKFELHRRRKFDQYYFFKAAVIDTVSEQMVESLLCPSSIPVSLASYIEIVDISLEWDSFDAFIKKVSVDQSHRSWCRRHEAAQRLQKIISERGESISSIIISVVNSIYTDNFLGSRKASNAESPLTASHMIMKLKLQAFLEDWTPNDT